MNNEITNTLIDICKNNEEYTLIYTPAHDRIAMVDTTNYDNEIFYIEKAKNNEWKFESDIVLFVEADINFIISTIYATLINSKFSSLIEDLNIDDVKDLNKMIEDIKNLKDKYC